MHDKPPACFPCHTALSTIGALCYLLLAFPASEHAALYMTLALVEMAKAYLPKQPPPAT